MSFLSRKLNKILNLCGKVFQIKFNDILKINV